MSFSPPVTSSTTSIGPASESQNKSLTTREGKFQRSGTSILFVRQDEIFNMLHHNSYPRSKLVLSDFLSTKNGYPSIVFFILLFILDLLIYFIRNSLPHLMDDSVYKSKADSKIPDMGEQKRTKNSHHCP